MASNLVATIHDRVALAQQSHQRCILWTKISSRTPLRGVCPKPFVRWMSPYPRHKRRRANSVVPQINVDFWMSTFVWKRAAINTLRCLIGCTLGDFSTMWFLQVHYPSLGIGVIMATSSKIESDPAHTRDSDSSSCSGLSNFHVARDNSPSTRP